LAPLFAAAPLLLSSACSTLRYQTKYEAKSEPVRLATPRVPLKALLVVPDYPERSLTSPRFWCPLLTHRSQVTVDPAPALERTASPVLSQYFTGIDVVADKSEASGSYSAVIEMSLPEVSFAKECNTGIHLVFDVSLIGTGIALMTHFAGGPDIMAVAQTRVSVSDGRGEKVIADMPVSARGMVAEAWNILRGPTDVGVARSVERLYSNLFREVALALDASPKFQRLVKDPRRPVVMRPPAAAPAAPEPDVDALPRAAARPDRSRHAVVVGIERYRQNAPKADHAANDARVVAAYLTRALGVPEENIALLLDDKASRGDIEKYVEAWLPNRVEEGDTVYFYYSGHGAPNLKTNQGYLVPYDGDPSFIEQTGYSLERLFDRLGSLGAKRTVVLLDSCFSGSGSRSLIAKGTRPFVVTLEAPPVGDRMAVLSASAGEQTSTTYDRKRHGLFTYFLLKGLRGEADAVKDGTLDLAGLYDYIRPRVESIARREFNVEQTPQLKRGPGLSR
jgi:hypothetical protein